MITMAKEGAVLMLGARIVKIPWLSSPLKAAPLCGGSGRQLVHPEARPLKPGVVILRLR